MLCCTEVIIYCTHAYLQRHKFFKSKVTIDQIWMNNVYIEQYLIFVPYHKHFCDNYIGHCNNLSQNVLKSSFNKYICILYTWTNKQYWPLSLVWWLCWYIQFTMNTLYYYYSGIRQGICTWKHWTHVLRWPNLKKCFHCDKLEIDSTVKKFQRWYFVTTTVNLKSYVTLDAR